MSLSDYTDDEIAAEYRARSQRHRNLRCTEVQLEMLMPETDGKPKFVPGFTYFGSGTE